MHNALQFVSVPFSREVKHVGHALSDALCGMKGLRLHLERFNSLTSSNSIIETLPVQHGFALYFLKSGYGVKF